MSKEIERAVHNWLRNPTNLSETRGLVGVISEHDPSAFITTHNTIPIIQALRIVGAHIPAPRCREARRKK